ncbi:SBF-like CPA transporter family-domain-containing protein [Phascolomyces articulosus]|uniref:SBF-like CPA transporter family-domain-containing protein n=1 Tax=Phascolomyces articulosus TaxID=60185 RepID=A0AAD5P828_9FUNG|nr:SBF-like CPA transporter family-domain-containing protein [Phascolomyces articulosus]
MNESRLKSSTSLASDTTTIPPQHLSSSSTHHQGYRPSPLSNTISDKSSAHHHQQQQHNSTPLTRKQKLRKFGKKSWIVAKSLFKRYWFLVGLAFVIMLAVLAPDVARQQGYIHAEWTIKWGAVIVIFLISGLSLRTQTLAKTVLRVRLHMLVQIINLIMIPFFVFGLVLLFFHVHMNLNSLLLVGLVIAACTPTTVSSNVVMTKNAGGNEATALMNAALGNVLGIFVSPALLQVFQQPLIDATPENDTSNTVDGTIDFVSVLKQLGITVLVPLVVGQIIQWMFPEKIAKFKVKFRLSDVSSICLLTLVWSVFSDAIHAGSFGNVNAVDIIAIAIINAGFYILFSSTCWFLAYLPVPQWMPYKRVFDRLSYSREDTVAVMYCGATKTVALGMPLINVLYQKGDPGQVGVLSTPLLLYHVEQLILGNIEVDIMKRWIKRGKQQQQEDQEKTGDNNNNNNTMNHLDNNKNRPRDEEEDIMMVQDGSTTRIGGSSMTIPKITTNFKDFDGSCTQIGGSNLTLPGAVSPTKEKYYSRDMVDTPTTQVEITVSPPDTPTKPHHYDHDDDYYYHSSPHQQSDIEAQHEQVDDNNNEITRNNNNQNHHNDNNSK